MAFEYDPGEFDFEASGVTEDAYFDVLDDICANPTTLDVSHSLPLNEVRVFIEPDAESGHAFGFPAGFTIHGAAYTQHDEFGDCIELILSTTRFLSTDDEQEEFFPGTYSDEGMAFAKAQLDLFGEIRDSILTRSPETGRLSVFAKASDTLTSTYVFDEVLTYLGLSIDMLWVIDGNIEYLSFAFDGSSEFSRETADTFRLSKQRAWKNACVDIADPVSAPCGHDAETRLMIFEAMDSIDGSDHVDVDGVACVAVPVIDTDDVILRPDGETDDEGDDTTEGYTSTRLARGFLCDLCETAYIACDADAMRDRYANPLPITDVTVSVPDSDDTHTFLVFDHPYKPADEMYSRSTTD